jgi:uncharacterized protein YcbK (DUF882 family)
VNISFNKGIFATTALVFIVVLFVYIYYAIKNGLLSPAVIKKRLTGEDMEYKYFTYSEFDSPCADEECDKCETYKRNGKLYIKNSGKQAISKALIKALDEVREEFGYAIIVTSGVRTPAYNKTLKGSVSNSAHIYGLAADITCKNFDAKKDKLLSILRKHFVRIGKGVDFFHVDLDSTKRQVEWRY